MQVKKLRAILRDQGLIKKQISGDTTKVSGGEDTAEIPSVVVAHPRTENLNSNQIYGIDQYNNQMLVASSCWPPYPWKLFLILETERERESQIEF